MKITKLWALEKRCEYFLYVKGGFFFIDFDDQLLKHQTQEV